MLSVLIYKDTQGIKYEAVQSDGEDRENLPYLLETDESGTYAAKIINLKKSNVPVQIANDLDDEFEVYVHDELGTEIDTLPSPLFNRQMIRAMTKKETHDSITGNIVSTFRTTFKNCNDRHVIFKKFDAPSYVTGDYYEVRGYYYQPVEVNNETE